MAKTKKQNSTQVPIGGYTLNPTYSTTYPGSNYSNISITGSTGLTYTTATSASTWATNITLDPYYTKKPKVEITDTDLVIDGQSLKDFMRSVQKELSIPGRLNRNKVLEAEFAELEAAADQYYKLEEKFLEQKAIWETLKKTD
jgi:hypothetical protein